MPPHVANISCFPPAPPAVLQEIIRIANGGSPRRGSRNVFVLDITEKMQMLLKLYFVLLVAAAIRCSCFNFSSWYVFFVHTCLVFGLTANYSSRKTAFAAFGDRLFFTSMLSKPVQYVCFGVLACLFFAVAVAFLTLFKPNAVSMEAEYFQKLFEQFKGCSTNILDGFHDLCEKTHIHDSLIIYITPLYVASLALWNTFLAWVLTKGYSRMVDGSEQGGEEVKIVQVYDILILAMVGAAGTQIGGAMYNLLWKVLGLGLWTSTSWWFAIVVEPASQIINLVQVLLSSAIVALSAAETVVLRMPLKMCKSLLLVFALNLFISASAMQWSKESMWQSRPLLCMGTAMFTIGGLVFAIGKCKNLYCALAEKEAEKRD